MSPDTDNGRVTLAVLQSEVKALREHMDTRFDALAEQMTSARQERQDNARQIRRLEIDASTMASKLLEHCNASIVRWQDHEKEHTRESFILKAWATVSATISGAIAGVFAWFTSH